jgi:hypothetical protein
MPNYEYRSIIVNHGARELSISGGGTAEQVDGGYYAPVGVFNQLGAEGWRLTTSVYERLEGVGDFTFHYFTRES